MKKMAIDYKSHFATDTFTLVAKIPPKEIGYVNSIIESYEGIGVLRTRDGKEGIVEFWVVPFFEKEFMELIEELKTEIPLTILS